MKNTVADQRNTVCRQMKHVRKTFTGVILRGEGGVGGEGRLAGEPTFHSSEKM